MKYNLNITAMQFLKNPTGKGSATVARRDRIIYDMRQRFSYLYKNSRRQFKLEVYKHSDLYYFYFKIPSEEIHDYGLNYDVIIEFSPPNEKVALTHDLNKYNIRFISNSPNFMFTYGYLYNKEKLLISWLSHKLGKKALTEEPVVRNPQQEFGFEKSVYFALLYLELNPKEMKRPSYLSVENRNLITQKFPNSELKLKENQQKKKIKNQKEKSKKKNTSKNSSRETSAERKLRKTKPINTKVKPIGKVGKVKKKRTLGKRKSK